LKVDGLLEGEKQGFYEHSLLYQELRYMLEDMHLSQDGQDNGLPLVSDTKVSAALQHSVDVAEASQLLTMSHNASPPLQLLGISGEFLNDALLPPSTHSRQANNLFHAVSPDLTARLLQRCATLQSFYDSTPTVDLNSSQAGGRAKAVNFHVVLQNADVERKSDRERMLRQQDLTLQTHSELCAVRALRYPVISFCWSACVFLFFIICRCVCTCI